MLLTTLLLDVQGGSLPPVTNVTLPWLDYPCLVVDMSHHAIVCIETGYLPDHDHAHSKPLINMAPCIHYLLQYRLLIQKQKGYRNSSHVFIHDNVVLSITHIS